MAKVTMIIEDIAKDTVRIKMNYKLKVSVTKETHISNAQLMAINLKLYVEPLLKVLHIKQEKTTEE